MQIQLQINENKIDFFLEYLNSLKDGIIEKIEIQKEVNQSFMIDNVDEVKKRVENAENSANYSSHEEFWEAMGIK
jgi:hypothetical protein